MNLCEKPNSLTYLLGMGTVLMGGLVLAGCTHTVYVGEFVDAEPFIEGVSPSGDPNEVRPCKAKEKGGACEEAIERNTYIVVHSGKERLDKYRLTLEHYDQNSAQARSVECTTGDRPREVPNQGRILTLCSNMKPGWVKAKFDYTVRRWLKKNYPRREVVWFQVKP